MRGTDAKCPECGCLRDNHHDEDTLAEARSYGGMPLFGVACGECEDCNQLMDVDGSLGRVL